MYNFSILYFMKKSQEHQIFIDDSSVDKEFVVSTILKLCLGVIPEKMAQDVFINRTMWDWEKFEKIPFKVVRCNLRFLFRIFGFSNFV